MEKGIKALRSKADQAWEMVGLARKDGNQADEIKQTQIARDYPQQIADILDK